jgi:hypothetical protein
MTFGTHSHKFAYLSVFTGWIRRDFAKFPTIFDSVIADAMNKC